MSNFDKFCDNTKDGSDSDRRLCPDGGKAKVFGEVIKFVVDREGEKPIIVINTDDLFRTYGSS